MFERQIVNKTRMSKKKKKSVLKWQPYKIFTALFKGMVMSASIINKMISPK